MDALRALSILCTERGTELRAKHSDWAPVEEVPYKQLPPAIQATVKRLVYISRQRQVYRSRIERAGFAHFDTERVPRKLTKIRKRMDPAVTRAMLLAKVTEIKRRYAIALTGRNGADARRLLTKAQKELQAIK